MTTLQEALATALNSLEQWAALIKHQYTGTSEGMTDLQLADNAGMMAIEALKSALAQQGEQQPVCHGCGIPAGDVHMSTCKSGKWPSRVSNGDTAAHGIREVK